MNAGEFWRLSSESRTLFRDHPDTISAVIAASAFLGAIAGQIVAFLARKWAYWRERKAWRIALREELQYLFEVLQLELVRDVRNKGYSIKRLNDDFLADARLKGYTFDVNTEFIRGLAATYRDVVHTNSVLELAMTKPSDKYERELDSLKGVNGSIGLLKIYVERKLMHFWNPRKYRKAAPLGLPSVPISSEGDQENNSSESEA